MIDQLFMLDDKEFCFKRIQKSIQNSFKAFIILRKKGQIELMRTLHGKMKTIKWIERLENIHLQR